MKPYHYLGQQKAFKILQPAEPMQKMHKSVKIQVE